ncbi:para-nitrobenzyl esterase [Photobacterium rosenbergii]|uniref:Para-nitrobenzyl esterase n=1 Tax=Photobacterium rosenbergii TaxID=294936 RepID=A0A2T3NHX9_9GAMM|nr:carboxylesterase family protein [Photobacterium rosenbergii]PSW14591.1 para-nitrobenzyl esterase [Photobacterium rosenbergii]
MKLFTRTLVATTIAMGLAACGGDNKNESPVNNSAVVYSDNATITGVTETVQINNIQGETEKVQIEAYKGIRFAEAGRFQHSQVKSLSGNIAAIDFGDICPQSSASTTTQSEDCLNLNIWRPANIENYGKLPVYVFIHGGLFETGSGSHKMNHGDVIVAQSVSDTALGERTEPFIAVTLNYRLGLLGSLWIDPEDDPKGGNYGIGDQKRALEWVNQNIGFFGGDSQDVTVFGQGAGASSIAILQQVTDEEQDPDRIDDIAGKYFSKAIMQSNSVGLALKSNKSAAALSESLVDFANTEYPEQSSENVLKNLPIDKLLVVQEKAKGIDTKISNKLSNLLSTYSTSSLLPYAPYIENYKKFITEKKGYHVTEQKHQVEFKVPTVLGFNEHESNSFASLIELLFLYNISDGDEQPLLLPELGYDTTINELFDHLTGEESELEDGLKETLETVRTVLGELIKLDLDQPVRQNMYPVVASLFFGSDTTSEIFKLEDYKPNNDQSLLDGGAAANIGKFHKLLNDLLFDCASYVLAQEQKQPVTLYQFKYNAGFSVWPIGDNDGILDKINGIVKSIGCLTGKACNGSELPFVFNNNYNMDEQKMLSLSGKDKALQSKMSRVWFTDEIFNQYDSESDNVWVVDKDGVFEEKYKWDAEYNQGQDPALQFGTCKVLKDNGILFNYMN